MKDSEIRAVIEPALVEFSLELEAVDIVPAGKRRVLRVVVDGDGPDGTGPSLDDIAEATRAVSTALDAADVTGSAPYTLEVSSRGVGRPLTLPRHWRRNVTRLVRVTRTDDTTLTGRIRSSDDEQVHLEVDGNELTLAYADIAKAMIEVELNRKSAKGADTGSGSGPEGAATAVAEEED